MMDPVILLIVDVLWRRDRERTFIPTSRGTQFIAGSLVLWREERRVKKPAAEDLRRLDPNTVDWCIDAVAAESVDPAGIA